VIFHIVLIANVGCPDSEIAHIALNVHACYFVKEQHIYGYIQSKY